MDGFELAVRAILGQRISVSAATTLAGRLANAFGEDIVTPFPGLNRLSPTAARIAGLVPRQLVRLGITRERAMAIIELARIVKAGEIDLQPGSDPVATCKRLMEIPGIGQYVSFVDTEDNRVSLLQPIPRN